MSGGKRLNELCGAMKCHGVWNPAKFEGLRVNTEYLLMIPQLRFQVLELF